MSVDLGSGWKMACYATPFEIVCSYDFPRILDSPVNKNVDYYYFFIHIELLDRDMRIQDYLPLTIISILSSQENIKRFPKFLRVENSKCKIRRMIELNIDVGIYKPMVSMCKTLENFDPMSYYLENSDLLKDEKFAGLIKIDYEIETKNKYKPADLFHIYTTKVGEKSGIFLDVLLMTNTVNLIISNLLEK